MEKFGTALGMLFVNLLADAFSALLVWWLWPTAMQPFHIPAISYWSAFALIIVLQTLATAVKRDITPSNN